MFFFRLKDLDKQKKQGFIFLSFGILLIGFFSVWRFHQERVLSFSEEYPEEISAQEEKIGVNPVFISIPSVGIDLLIEKGSIKNGVWEISFDGASHLDKSADVNEGGNIVIYGHNKNSLFGPIRWLKNDSEIKITGEDGNEYIYKVINTIEVNPDDLTYVLPKEEETLTLYTCTGLFDSKRFIVIAKREN